MFIAAIGLLFLIFVSGIRVLRPTHRGVVETLGKFSRFARPGFHWVIPIIHHLYRLNITETMSDIEPQDIITEDNLNASVDLVVFYKVKDDEESIKRAFYSVNEVTAQIVTLAKTTARSVIGEMNFSDVNSKRKELNVKLADVMSKETANWGVEVVRVELKEIAPPDDVQEAMNAVIKAENQKRAAVDFATAVETEADGKRRAAIKEAEGKKQASILEAEGQAQAFDLIY